MKKLTHARLLELLSYDANTGVFTYRMCRGGHAEGSTAGWLDKQGYMAILIEGEWFSQQRLAWFYVTGAWPLGEIDHRNGVRHENQFSNLRECTRSENCGNRKAKYPGFKGLSLSKKPGRFQAMLRDRYIGTFDSVEEAAAAYDKAATVAYGEFARTNAMETKQ